MNTSLDLYRLARRGSLAALAEAIFAAIKRALPIESGAIVTSFPNRPSFLDAHFFGIEDPRALMQSWQAVAHLDPLSARVVERPFEVHRQDSDDPAIAGPELAPLREHLERFRLYHSLFVAVPLPEDECATVFIASRHRLGARFSDDEAAALAALAPDAAEAAATCRALALAHHPRVGLEELELALVDNDGRLIHTTRRFREAVFGTEAPQQPHLPREALAALSRGEAWPVPDQEQILEGFTDDRGLLVRARKKRAIDRLSAREREVGRRYAAGDSYQEVARALGIAPATARNHLRNIYQKLGIRQRVELVRAFDPRGPARDL